MYMHMCFDSYNYMKRHMRTHAWPAPHTWSARNRSTALMCALDNGDTDVAKLLLSKPDLDINAADIGGYVGCGAAGCSADMRTCGHMCMDGGHMCT